jgi:hypothetical protein
MAGTRRVWDETFKAAADLSTKQYFAVEMTAADTVNVTNAAADRALGILQDKPKTGEGGAVRLLGISEAVTDGSGTAIAVGDYVGPNNVGKMVKKATADFSVLGIALDASSADGTIIRVLLPGGVNWFRSSAG